MYAGADFVSAGKLDKLPNENYYGYSTAVGAGVPGGDVHVKMSNMYPMTKTYNIFDFLFGTVLGEYVE